MKRTGFGLFVLGMIVCLAAVPAAAQTRYSDVAPGSQVPGGPTEQLDLKPLGTLTFYGDRPSFDAAHPGLPVENFSGGPTPPASLCSDIGPLDDAGDLCFPAGSVLPGFAMAVVGDPTYVLLTTGFLGNDCDAVGPNSFADSTSWSFNPAIAAVGFDLLDPITPGGSFTIEVFGPGGSLGSTVAVAGNVPSGLFFGVDTVDPGGITGITVTDVVGGEAELFCDLVFGDPPVPVDLQSFDIE